MRLEIDVHELHQWIQDAKPLHLLDIREDCELDICKFEKAQHIPMSDLFYSESEDLPKDIPLIVFCHHGRRSLQAILYLRDKGFENALSLKGGIDAWAREIDLQMNQY